MIKLKINNVELVISAVRQSQYPDDKKPEFLLLGRSNVGKSSFINTIIERKSFARISSTPGKTQTINFYKINNEFYLVDVPGYGYANTNKEKIKKFGKMIEEYLNSREELKRVFLLIDFRHKPSEDDILMYNFLKYYEKKVTIIMTKVDRVAKMNFNKHKKVIIGALSLSDKDSYILFSSTEKMGKENIQELIKEEVYGDI